MPVELSQSYLQEATGEPANDSSSSRKLVIAGYVVGAVLGVALVLGSLVWLLGWRWAGRMGTSCDKQQFLSQRDIPSDQVRV